jgi:hypothetical protein
LRSCPTTLTYEHNAIVQKNRQLSPPITKTNEKGKKEGITGVASAQLMDSRGIEPRTTPMLREYYTTKPQARVVVDEKQLFAYYHFDKY